MGQNAGQQEEGEGGMGLTDLSEYDFSKMRERCDQGSSYSGLVDRPLLKIGSLVIGDLSQWIKYFQATARS